MHAIQPDQEKKKNPESDVTDNFFKFSHLGINIKIASTKLGLSEEYIERTKDF